MGNWTTPTLGRPGSIPILKVKTPGRVEKLYRSMFVRRCFGNGRNFRILRLHVVGYDGDMLRGWVQKARGTV